MNRINLDWMTSFLDSHGCRYEISSFSHDFSDQEMIEVSEPLGVTLIKTEVVRIDGRATMVAVRSKNLLDPEKLKTTFHTDDVAIVSRQEVAQSLPRCPGGIVPPFAPLFAMDLVVDQSVATAKSVKFRVSPTNDFLRMDFPDFKRLFQPRLNSLQMSSFRAGVTAVVPASAKHWDQNPACFLGISLDNANFEGARFDAVLKWAGKHFSRVGILVADSIHRITLGILHPQWSEDQCRAEALARGRAFVEAHEGFPSNRKYACAFEVIACSDLERHRDFRCYVDDLTTLCSTHEGFHRSVRSFSEGFIDKKYATGELTDASAREGAVDRSMAYFLEELALCACLNQDGRWPVLVYPGSLSVFTDMIEDGFGSNLEVVGHLRSLTSLSLNLKGD